MTPSRRVLTVRMALLALCLLLSIDALATLASWRSNRGRLDAILREVAAGAGEGSGDVEAAIRRVAFERTPHHANLIVARALVYQTLAAGAPATPESLSVARELALEALRQQPNNWQASMFLGAATYLDWSSTSDRRLYTDAVQWERPLLDAIEAARGQPEPRRFLAAAYLETWAALSEAKKAVAFELVETMFHEDPGSFDRLGTAWFEITGDRERALDAVPNLPRPWQALKTSFADDHDWASFCLAHGRYLDALGAQLERQLDEARQRLRLGDLAGGRQLCLAVVAAAPPDLRFADLVSRALELYPPGLHGFRTRSSLDAWLRWALELNAVGVDPLSPKVIRRLSDAVGDLDPPTGALAALIGDDVYHIQRFERLEESKRRSEWAPFLIAKTRWLIERDDLDAASRALREAHRSAHSSSAYWRARYRLARATGDLSDAATCEQRLADFQARQWLPPQWLVRGQRLTLELYPEARSPGLSITLAGAPERGAVAELIVDGGSVAIRPVAAGQTIEVAVELDPTPHFLELRSLAGGEIQPGPVRLLDGGGELSSLRSRVGIEPRRARLRVRWLIRRFRCGPQSGSHSHVSGGPPTIPDGRISRVRF